MVSESAKKAESQFNQGDIQSAADANITEIGTAREHAVLNNHGSFTSQYHTDDMETQDIVNNAANNSEITAGKPVDMLRQLSSIIKSKLPAAKDLSDSVNNPAMSGETLDAHGTLLGYESNYTNQVQSEAKLVEQCANVLESFTKLPSQMKTYVVGKLPKIEYSMVGPVIAAIGGFTGKIKEAINDRRTNRENKQINKASQVTRQNDDPDLEF